jgi:UDP-MurNAc hydroxylase
MKIQWFRSATVGIETKSGTKILCDPWLTDGAFVGSWFHWPPLENEFAEVLGIEWDYLYVSHLHPDHFDRRFIAELARKNPNVKVLVPKFENSWLLRAISNCGFGDPRIYILDSNVNYTFEDFKVKVLTADYCNPNECGVSIPCSSDRNQKSTIDSLALFEADGHRILNANDALAVKSIESLWAKIGQVDLLMGHFGGAGPYPQCFIDIDDIQKTKLAEETAGVFVERLGNAANKTHAKFVFPYAGQYVLGGKLHVLNANRSVLPLDKVKKQLQKITSSNVITLSPFGKFDISTGQISKEWVEPTETIYEEYIKKISTIKFPYERKEIHPLDFKDSLKTAAERALRAYKVASRSDLQQPVTVSLKSETYSMNLNFCGLDSDYNSELDFESELQTTLHIPDQLFFRIVLKRGAYSGFTQFHFNQAEIGSHLSWERRGPYRNETKFLNFFHT